MSDPHANEGKSAGDKPSDDSPEGARDSQAAEQGQARSIALGIGLPIGLGVAIVLVVILVVALTPTKSSDSAGTGSGKTPADMGVAEIGSPAPEFTLKTIDGGEFKLSDHRGQVVLLNFWGTWCTPCEKEMPDLVKANDQHNGAVPFLGVAVNDTPDSVREFISRKGIDYPVGLDEGQIAGRYLVAGFPTTVIIDRDGIVRERVSRAFPDVAAINAAIARVEGATSPTSP